MRAFVTLCAVALVAACKPPPTDVDLGRELPEAEPSYASEPLPSPDTKGAVWAVSAKDADTLIYGVPGNQAVMAIACVGDSTPARIRITRMSPADEGAGAMLAMVGNGHIGRVPVDAVKVSGKLVWQGDTMAADSDLEPLAGPRQLTATIPGAGMVTLNPSALPMQLLDDCRAR